MSQLPAGSAHIVEYFTPQPRTPLQVCLCASGAASIEGWLQIVIGGRYHVSRGRQPISICCASRSGEIILKCSAAVVDSNFELLQLSFARAQVSARHRLSNTPDFQPRRAIQRLHSVLWSTGVTETAQLFLPHGLGTPTKCQCWHLRVHVNLICTTIVFLEAPVPVLHISRVVLSSSPAGRPSTSRDRSGCC